MGATPADSESNLTDEGKTRSAARSRGARQPAPRASLPSPFDPVTRDRMVRGWALRAAWPLDLPDQVQVQLTVSDSSGAFFFGKKIKWSCEGDYYIPRVPMSLTHPVPRVN